LADPDHLKSKYRPQDRTLNQAVVDLHQPEGALGGIYLEIVSLLSLAVRWKGGW
jgi:hypothetical protein